MAQDGTENELGGLFNISISDSEEGEDGGIDTSHGIASSAKKGREQRTGQSEDAFRTVKSGYRAKTENGEVSNSKPQAMRRVPAFPPSFPSLFFLPLLMRAGTSTK